MSRNLLHVSHLPSFQEFLIRNFIPFRPGRGNFQVLQIQLEDGQWACIYNRLEMPEHYSVDRRLDPLVKSYIKTMKGAK